MGEILPEASYRETELSLEGSRSIGKAEGFQESVAGMGSSQ